MVASRLALRYGFIMKVNREIVLRNRIIAILAKVLHPDPGVQEKLIWVAQAEALEAMEDFAKQQERNKMNNWKTTANGFLAAFLAIVGPASALQASLQSMHSAPDYTLAIAGAVLTCLASIARAWIGLLQTDAPEQK